MIYIFHGNSDLARFFSMLMLQSIFASELLDVVSTAMLNYFVLTYDSKSQFRKDKREEGYNGIEFSFMEIFPLVRFH